MDEKMQKHWWSFNVSPADAFTVPVPVWTHTKTNGANKSNSAVHRRFTTKVMGRDGALSCCLITDQFWHLTIVYVHWSHFGDSTVKVWHGDILMWQIQLNHFHLGDVLVIKSSAVILVADGFSCTNTAIFLPQNSESSVTCHNYHQTSPHLPQTLLAVMHLPSVKTKRYQEQIHGSYQSDRLQPLQSKQFISGVNARLCFSLEYPLCVWV